MGCTVVLQNVEVAADGTDAVVEAGRTVETGKRL
jgi:hypothetical protein